MILAEQHRLRNEKMLEHDTFICVDVLLPVVCEADCRVAPRARKTSASCDVRAVREESSLGDRPAVGCAVNTWRAE